jgi:hypothetical protein
MHEHNHNNTFCQHLNVKFCPQCGIVYCVDCNKEWTEPTPMDYYPGTTPVIPYIQPYTPWCNGDTIITCTCGDNKNVS